MSNPKKAYSPLHTGTRSCIYIHTETHRVEVWVTSSPLLGTLPEHLQKPPKEDVGAVTSCVCSLQSINTCSGEEDPRSIYIHAQPVHKPLVDAHHAIRLPAGCRLPKALIKKLHCLSCTEVVVPTRWLLAASNQVMSVAVSSWRSLLSSSRSLKQKITMIIYMFYSFSGWLCFKSLSVNLRWSDRSRHPSRFELLHTHHHSSLS